MTEPTIESDSRWRRGALLAFPAGLVAALAVTLQWFEIAALRSLPVGPTIAATLVLVGMGWRELRRARGQGQTHAFDASRLGLWLSAAALAVASTAEQPIWPSIDTYGTAVAIPYLAVLGLAGALAFDCTLTKTRRVDSALAILTIFAAFGGPLFLREGSLYHAHYGLLCIAAFGYALPEVSIARFGHGSRLAWGILILIGLGILPFATAVDRGQHLAGFLRILIAFAPLPLILAANDRARAARATLFAFAFALLIGGLAAASAILEASLYVDLEHVLRARLSLFGEHPNIIAPYFAVGIPLVVAACFQTRSRALRFTLVGIAVLGFVALELTQSRASRAGGAVGIVIVLALGCCRPLTRRLDTQTKRFALLGLLVLLTAGGGFALRHKIRAKLVDPSMEFRVYMWQTARTALETRPWFGFGYSSSEPLMAYAEPSDLDGRTKDTHPHMMLLSFALGSGVPSAILFALLMLAVALRALSIAASADDLGIRFLAGGIAASLIALFLSNLLDQGLSLHAPIPLHFGTLLVLLLGTLARTGAPIPQESVVTSAAGSPLLKLAVVAVALHSTQTLIADRASGRARIAAQRRDYANACTLASIAHSISPLDRRTTLRYAEALDRAGDRQGAADALARATETFPLSPYPWEQLANLEYDRRNWTSALAALARARERDSTGPSASQWSLRIANIYANTGRRDEAIAELASAIRFDYDAAARAGWKQDGQKEYFIPVVDSDSPIFLSGILTKNRELLPEAVKDEPVRARRLATTLVKIALSFRKFDFAREVITEYKSLTSEPWLPLEHLESDLDRILRSDAAPDPSVDTPVVDGNPAVPTDPEVAVVDSPPSSDRFAGVAGRAVVFLDEGRAFAEAKDYRRALDSFRLGLEASYDIVAERQYIATLQDSIFQAAIDLGDLALANRALAPNLYFHAQPSDRLSISRRLARAQIGAADLDGAAKNLRRCGELLRMLAAGRCDDSASDLGEVLGSLLTAKDARQTALASALLAELETHGGGLLTAMYAYRAANRLEQADQRSQRLRREFPEWLAGGRTRKPKK